VTIFAIMDTETTGVESHDQVVEISALLVSGSRRVTWSTLVKPSVPVCPAARAAHHIGDEELALAPTPAEVLLRAPLGLLKNSVMVAHNLDFDARLLTQSGLAALLPERRICTLRCSRHVWPASPGHSNQLLRYWLGLRVPSSTGLPHRADADVVVTHLILEELLREHDIDALCRLTGKPVLLPTVQSGKYRGQPWSEMDEGYLRWVLDPKRQYGEDVTYTARHWLERKRARKS
jgi:exodeoxyribonuclease X